MKIFKYALLLIVFSRCAAQQQQLGCYETQLAALKQTLLYTDVKSQALDSLHSWINNGIMASGIPPLRNGFEWKIDDAIFFNSNKTKVIFLILEKDTVSNAKSDYLQFYFGVRIKQHWQFYFKSLLTMYIPRKQNEEYKAHSFEELSATGIKQVLQEYYKRGTCNIDDKFFDYDLKNLQEKHENFLIDK